jgi:hypothetical protein
MSARRPRDTCHGVTSLSITRPATLSSPAPCGTTPEAQPTDTNDHELLSDLPEP